MRATIAPMSAGWKKAVAYDNSNLLRSRHRHLIEPKQRRVEQNARISGTSDKIAILAVCWGFRGNLMAGKRVHFAFERAFRVHERALKGLRRALLSVKRALADVKRALFCPGARASGREARGC
jgi:hypothetical protein